MKKINLIFDLDGTLVDSYDSISEWFHRVMLHYGLNFSTDYLRELCLTHNADFAMNKFSVDYNLDLNELHAYSKTVVQNLELIKPYPNVLSVIENPKYNVFIYTHRGKTTDDVLNITGLKNKFIDVITSLDKFPRKPAPDGVLFLISKHKLIKQDTYYVGDRLLDIECGKNAGIKTIFVNSSNLNIDSSSATFVVEKIEEINSLSF